MPLLDDIQDELAKDWHSWLLAVVGAACALFRKKIGEVFSWLWKKMNASAIAIDGLTKLISEVKPTLEALKEAVEKQNATSQQHDGQVAVALAMANVLLGYHKTPTWICDEKGMCIFANAALCELFGREESDMMGLGWTAAIDADDILNVQTVWDAFREHPERQYKSRYRIVKDGHRLSVDASGVAIKSPVGRVAGFIGRVEPMPIFNA